MQDCLMANWNTSNLTSMINVFYQCTNLTTLDMSGWDTDKVTDTSGFLLDCSKLTTS